MKGKKRPVIMMETEATARKPQGGSGEGARAAHGSMKEVERDDPMFLKATFVPGPPEDVERMAESLVIEYARIGMPKEEIFRLFRRPHFRGTHRYYAAYGEQATRALIDRTLAKSGIARLKVENFNTSGIGGGSQTPQTYSQPRAEPEE